MYTWHVTERAAPGARDGSSVMWMYHSHAHEVQDSYAGLMGAIIITRRVRLMHCAPLLHTSGPQYDSTCRGGPLTATNTHNVGMKA